MPHMINTKELEKLESLIGKEISVQGHCTTEDEHGVAHTGCDIHRKGILRQVNYDEETKTLKSIIYEDRFGKTEDDLSTQDSTHVWGIHLGVYHNNQNVLDFHPNERP